SSTVLRQPSPFERVQEPVKHVLPGVRVTAISERAPKLEGSRGCARPRLHLTVRPIHPGVGLGLGGIKKGDGRAERIRRVETAHTSARFGNNFPVGYGVVNNWHGIVLLELLAKIAGAWTPPWK